MAVTISYGKCLACKENNAMTAEMCRKCSADLPWSKRKKAADKAAMKAAVAPQVRAQAVAKSPALPQIDGMLLFMAFVAFTMPVIGYFVWRSYADDDSEYTSVIGWASLLGLLAHIARAIVR